jgi:hypothetical protein
LTQRAENTAHSVVYSVHLPKAVSKTLEPPFGVLTSFQALSNLSSLGGPETSLFVLTNDQAVFV